MLVSIESLRGKLSMSKFVDLIEWVKRQMILFLDMQTYMEQDNLD